MVKVQESPIKKIHYEDLRKKGMSKERAARIAGSSDVRAHGSQNNPQENNI